MERTRKALGRLGTDPADLTMVFRAACLDICETVQATRASIWLFTPQEDAIVCEQLFDRRTELFSSGQVLRRQDYPGYFTALYRDRLVNAADALAHPATAEFRDGYFAPADIRSLLDHVVFAGDKPVATLCAEGCGHIHPWTGEDAAYLSQMAILLGIAIDTRRAQAA